jgi:hypothetical protein
MPPHDLMEVVRRLRTKRRRPRGRRSRAPLPRGREPGRRCPDGLADLRSHPRCAWGSAAHPVPSPTVSSGSRKPRRCDWRKRRPTPTFSRRQRRGEPRRVGLARGRPRRSVFRPKDRVDMRGLPAITSSARSELTSGFRGAIHELWSAGSTTGSAPDRLRLAVRLTLRLAVRLGGRFELFRKRRFRPRAPRLPRPRLLPTSLRHTQVSRSSRCLAHIPSMSLRPSLGARALFSALEAALLPVTPSRPLAASRAAF